MKCKAVVEVTLPIMGPVPIPCGEEAGHHPQTPHSGQGSIPIHRLGLTLAVPIRWGGPLDGDPSGEPPRRPSGATQA